MTEYTWKEHTIHIEEAGLGQTLMLFPGNTASSAHYGQAVAHWAESFHVICPDLLGTGQSSRLDTWPPDWWEENAHMADSLLDQMGIESCIAAGSSGGAIVALLLAILQPHKVKAVIADSVVSAWLPGQISATVEQRQILTKPMVQFWQAGHGEGWKAVIQADGEMLLAFEQQVGDWTKNRLQQITCPVLFTASLNDQMLPQIAQDNLKMASTISNCALYFTTAGNHPLIWTAPQAFFGTVQGFLEEQNLYGAA